MSLIKNWWMTLKRSHKINITRKIFLVTIFFTFFIFSTTILIFTITPASFKSYLSDPRLNPASNYNSFVEYPDFPGNSGGSVGVPSLSLENILKDYCLDGIQSGSIFNDKSNSFEVPKITDKIDGNKVPYYTRFRGLSTYNPDVINKNDKLSIVNTTPGIYKNNNSDNYFEKLLKYFLLNNSNNPLPLPKNEIERDSVFESELLIGVSMEYLRGQNINSSFIKTFQTLDKITKTHLSFLNNFFGYSLGVKYKLNNPNDTKDVTWYGGDKNTTPLSLPSQVFTQGVIQQLNEALKYHFYNNDFGINFGTIPYDSKQNELYTYLNGTYKNNKQQIWGVSFNNNDKLPSDRESLDKNDSGGSRFNLKNDDNILLGKKISIQNSENIISQLENAQINSNFNFGNGLYHDASVKTIIPVIVNKTFANKHHTHLNSTIDYQVNVPRTMVTDNKKSIENNKPYYEQASASNFYSKGFLSINDITKPTIGNWFYKTNDSSGKSQFFSTTMLNGHYKNEFPNTSSGTQVNNNAYKMFLDTKKTNVKFKIVGITNNYGTGPLIYMNKSIANILNGYTIQGSTYGSNSQVDNNAFNAKFSKLNTPKDINSVITYSWCGDYTSLGLNGSPMFYFEKNPYTGEEGSGFYRAITNTAPGGYPILQGETPNINNIGEVNPVEGRYDNYNFDWSKKISTTNPATFFNKPSTWGIVNAFSINDLRRTIDNDYSFLNSVAGEIYLILGCISLLILIFGFKIIVYRNIKHISILRILGYGSREILKEVFSFYILLAALGFALAIPFATFISTSVSGTIIIQSKLPNLGISALSFTNLALGVFCLLFFYFIITIFLGIVIYRTKPLRELNDK